MARPTNIEQIIAGVRAGTVDEAYAAPFLLDEIDRLRRGMKEISRLRLATDEGSLARRADRMREIAMDVIGRPQPGAKPFP